MKYYQVAPLAYFGRKTGDILTYKSNLDLEVGQAVHIFLRTKKIIGIVLDQTKKPSFPTKEIVDSIFEKPILIPRQLDLARWISGYYAANLGSTLSAFIPQGLDKKRRLLKEALAPEKPVLAPTLTKDQEMIVSKIVAAKDNKPHLLFGVTGSGKTEVYFRLIEEALREKKQIIYLVPEISLTPMMVERLRQRFGDKVVLFHSYLKETERYINWKSVFDGQKPIVVGSRSALFAPLENLGLIIIDEEHESSYKQDQTPRYHTVKVAEKLAGLSGCRLILGSATPSLESYHKAQSGIYHLHTLKERVVQKFLPQVAVVDMRNEYKYGNQSIFSETLQIEIKKTLAAKKQVLLFINRRGMSTFINCRDCGYVAKCPHCDLALTFHYKDLGLVCHHCGFRSKVPSLCPDCHGLAIKYFGTGTQRVEVELKKLLGDKYTIERMDRDTIKERDSHKTVYANLVNKKTDVLIGTQMITKGWDIANIGLIGIISADTMINFPDFYASEKTFSLLTQVAGRTGRGSDPGKVILQTYNPQHNAIRYAAKHDYLGFYKEEIADRETLAYPPFAHLVKLLYTDKIQSIGEEKAVALAKEIEKLQNKNIIEVLGPSPSFLPKVAGKYRWQVTVKVKETGDSDFIKTINELKELAREIWRIDVDALGII